MKLRLQALRSLRLNYKRRGVWVWLKGRKRCHRCRGRGEVPAEHMPFGTIACPTCNGKPKRGYQRILSEPRQVLAEQEAAAEGVFV